MAAQVPISIFYAYARADEPFRRKLEKHLSLLQQQDLISQSFESQILEGADWKQILEQHIETASIILLLVSPDFFSSDDVYDSEVRRRTLARLKDKEPVVIPILLRPTDVDALPLEQYQKLPRNKKPLVLWRNQDSGFSEVAQEIRFIIEQLNVRDTETAASSASGPLSSLVIDQKIDVGEKETIGARVEEIRSGASVTVKQHIKEAFGPTIGIEAVEMQGNTEARVEQTVTHAREQIVGVDLKNIG